MQLAAGRDVARDVESLVEFGSEILPAMASLSFRRFSDSLSWREVNTNLFSMHHLSNRTAGVVSGSPNINSGRFAVGELTIMNLNVFLIALAANITAGTIYTGGKRQGLCPSSAGQALTQASQIDAKINQFDMPSQCLAGNWGAHALRPL
ncbi:hypothetical protein C8R44DRAFT_745758 [Mycena epipterygia]|nr:hypothetical protein C8R44DRAFT_745758 [Mycena epipterygia]